MSKYYRDRVAVVTGAGSGIGRALCKALAADGAKVWATDLDAKAAQATAETIGQPERHRHLDVTDAAQFEEVIDSIWTEEGPIDLLFNNAGIAVIGHYHEMSLADFNRLIDVNLRGVFHGVQAIYPRMMARGSGHIVNTSSVSGLIPAPGFTAYSATKHAVVGLSRGLRLEAQKHGVRVSAICPGFIDTELAQNADYRGIDGEAARKASPIEFGTPEACARDALKGVAKNQGEIVVTAHAKAMVAAHKHTPRIFGALARAGVKRSEK